MNDTLTKSINVRITKKLDDAIKEQARIQKRKAAQVIRLALEDVFLEEEKKIMGAIIIEQRAHDWIAYTADQPNRWEAGATEQEAIDKLLVTIKAEEKRAMT